MGIGGSEILLIFLVVLLLFGSKKIPDLAREFGKGMREFKKATDDIKREISQSEVMSEVNDLKSDMNRHVSDVQDNIGKMTSELNKEVSEVHDNISKTTNDLNKDIPNI